MTKLFKPQNRELSIHFVLTTTLSGPIHYLINYHYSYTSNIHIQFIHQFIITHLTIPATDAVEKNFYSSQNSHYTDIDISDNIN